MPEPKTKATDADVSAFLEAIPDATRRADCQALAALFAQATGQAPRLWGTSIVGFGSSQYRGSNGKAVDWFPVGFASRKSDLTLYLTGGHTAQADLMERLGKHRTGGGCIYIKRLSDVDREVLLQLIARAYGSTPARRP